MAFRKTRGPVHWWFIETAPRNATEFEVMLSNGEITRAHWACDLSGEEQPPFRGWFTPVFEDDGRRVRYFNQIKDPILYRRLPDALAR